MRQAVLIIILFSILFFGCVEQRTFSKNAAERIVNTKQIDFDEDEIFDYRVYDFAPAQDEKTGLRIERQLSISTKTSANYSSKNKLSDEDLLLIDQSMDEFTKARSRAENECGNLIGLFNIVCSDTTTCSKLCSTTSVKCKKVANIHEDSLSASMISFIKDNNEMRTLSVDARRMVFDLEANKKVKTDFLDKLRKIIGKIGQLNTNPLYSNPNLGLCQNSDYGVSHLIEIGRRLGKYSVEPTGYQYTMVLTIRYLNISADSTTTTGEISIIDKLPKTAVNLPEQVSSSHDLSLLINQNETSIVINSSKISKEGQVFYYQFASEEPVEDVLPKLKSPTVTVNKINFGFLLPINMLYQGIYSLVRNYYLSLGSALGFTVIFALIIYNLIIFVISLITERAVTSRLAAAFRKAFGRTDIHWKSDIVLALIFTGVAYYVSTAMTPLPPLPPTLLESYEYLLKNGLGMVGVSLAFFAVLMTYYAVENLVKITLLERIYGMAIKKEKDLYLTSAAALKNKVKELQELVEKYSQDEFDVSKEAEVVAGISAQKIDELAKDLTPRNKVLLEDYSSKIESATNLLLEKRKIADQNWEKWNDLLCSLLETQNQIIPSTVVIIPMSLRNWAMARFVRDNEDKVTIENGVIKKKKIGPEMLIRDFIAKNLIIGGVIFRDQKIIASGFGDASGTVISVLCLKLRGYLNALAKSLSQREATSFLSVGDKLAIAYIKTTNSESILCIPKEKFKEAIDQWKVSIKAVDTQ